MTPITDCRHIHRLDQQPGDPRDRHSGHISNWSGYGCTVRRRTGRDAGEIVGIGPIGVTTTNDLDDIIALKPDCVVYGAASAEMDAAAVRDYVRLLNGGLNVVTTNTPGMMFPDRWIPRLR